MIKRASWLLILFGVTTLVVTWRMGTQHWLTVHTGSENMPGTAPNYNFWSGFGSDLGEYTIAAGLFGHVGVLWRTHTCHRYWWCWRHPHHQLEGTPYMLCRHHHPDELSTVAEAVQAYKDANVAA